MAREIPLTQGYVALVDDADFEAVRQFKWHVHKTRRDDGSYLVYACRRVSRIKDDVRVRSTLFMHVFLCPDINRIDHKNGDGLNNSRSNIRPATASQNASNRRHKRSGCTSEYVGVSWNARARKWVAVIRVNYRLKFLGKFASEVDAAHAYNAAAVQHFGEFACQNHIN